MPEESRANDVRPYSAPFQSGQTDSSALPGISSKRGDNMKPPLLEEVARSAVGVARRVSQHDTAAQNCIPPKTQSIPRR